jgi:hypothetical protein
MTRRDHASQQIECHPPNRLLEKRLRLSQLETSPGNDVMCQALRKLATVKMPSSASRWPNSRRLVGPQASPLARGLALVRPHPLSRRGGATVGADSKARRCRKLSLVPLGPWKRCTVRRDRWAHESARLRLSSPEVVGNPSSKTGLIRPPSIRIGQAQTRNRSGCFG